MQTTIDSAGRLVIPSEVRRAAGIQPGMPVEVRYRDGRVEIEPAPLPVRLERRGRWMVAVIQTMVPPLGALAARFRALTPVTLLLLVVPLTWSIRDAKVLTRTDTRIVAHRWVEQHIAAGTRIAADPSTPSFERLSVLPLLLPGPGRGFDPNRGPTTARRSPIRVLCRQMESASRSCPAEAGKRISGSSISRRTHYAT